ncbi:Myb-binding protein 1A-like protein [Liparis tanakae]|uniref:Myb-binding protein 1A-like protein n=1 Tax=Liparis tanakae TaxID=230148 RepID=A0A4Z2E220_9TELE|nr:Myb-binding protein 1A-like protein [Liparis tanakae]
MGHVDVDRVSGTFRAALSSFMTKRKSPLTVQMFSDLFSRFPVLCVKLLDTLVQHVTSEVRVRQQVPDTSCSSSSSSSSNSSSSSSSLRAC